MGCPDAYDDPKPSDDDALEDLSERIYVLSAAEFPLLQAAEETYSEYGSLLPEIDDTLAIETEYGMRIRMYPKERFVEMAEHLSGHGHAVAPERVAIPIYFDYP